VQRISTPDQLQNESKSYLLLVLSHDLRRLKLERDVQLGQLRLEPGFPHLAVLKFLDLGMERLLQGVSAGQRIPQRSTLALAGSEPVSHSLRYLSNVPEIMSSVCGFGHLFLRLKPRDSCREMRDVRLQCLESGLVIVRRGWGPAPALISTVKHEAAPLTSAATSQ
jgi:hypothetical protein